MADILTDYRITNSQSENMMAPLELDLTAFFNIVQEDMISLINSAGSETSPDELISTITNTLLGKTDIKTAQIVTKESSLINSMKPLLRKIIVYGNIPIRIEQEIGSIRSGIDQDGHPWESKFHNCYGFFEETEGTDGDEVDVYLGEYYDTDMIYIIHQRDPVTGKYDEDKVMMFFDSPEEAKKTYLKHYDRPGMFGGLTDVDVDQFKRMIRDKKGLKLSSENAGEGSDIDVLRSSLRKLKDRLNGKDSRR